MKEVREKTILIVEDEMPIRALLRNALEEIPVEIVEAADGISALTLLEEWREEDPFRPWPNLILLDLGLPGMGGLQVLGKIRKREETRRIPVVIFSSDDQALVVRTAYERGANGYVVKPVRAPFLRESAKAVANYWLHWNTMAQ